MVAGETPRSLYRGLRGLVSAPQHVSDFVDLNRARFAKLTLKLALDLEYPGAKPPGAQSIASAREVGM